MESNRKINKQIKKDSFHASHTCRMDDGGTVGLAVGLKLLCRRPTAIGVASMRLVDATVAKIPVTIMFLCHFILCHCLGVQEIWVMIVVVIK